MTTWRVLKQVPPEHNLPSVATWAEVGTHESDGNYWLGTNAAQRIGEKFGAGDYLLFGEDNRANSLRIAERSEFYEVDDDNGWAEPSGDPTLKAVERSKLAASAAEIMEREG